MTLLQPELVAQLAAAFPDAVAWRNLADGDGLTLGEWHARSNRLAHGLRGMGVRRGDRVGLLIGNDEPLRWLVSYMGIHKAGAVAVPLLARLAPLELARILQRRRGHRRALCSEVPDGGPGRGRHRGGHGPRRRRALGRPALGRTTATSARSTARRRGRHHVHLGHDRRGRRASSCGTAASRRRARVPSAWLGLGFLTSSPFATTSGSLLVAGPLRGGLSGWFLPRFDARTAGSPPWSAIVPCRPSWCRRWWSSSSPRPGFATADLSSLAVVNSRQRAHRRGHAAPLRGGPPGGPTSCAATA